MKQTAKTVSSMSNEGRNLYVVRQITAAVLTLMQTYPLRDLSISQICQEAQVGRASFYRNFESKEDVIRKHLNSLTADWKKKHEGIGREDLVEAIFEHYWLHRELFLLLYRQKLSYFSLLNLLDTCGPKPDQSNVVAYTTAYLSYGLYGWVEEWFRRGMQETPKEMAELCLKAQRGEFQ